MGDEPVDVDSIQACRTRLMKLTSRVTVRPILGSSGGYGKLEAYVVLVALVFFPPMVWLLRFERPLDISAHFLHSTVLVGTIFLLIAFLSPFLSHPVQPFPPPWLRQ